MSTLRERISPAQLRDQADLRAMVGRKPRTRAECIDGPRPCPWLACRYHLGLSVSQLGTLHLPHGSAALDAGLAHSCSLDVADAGASNLSEIGAVMGVTKQRAHQLLAEGLDALRARLEADLTPAECELLAEIAAGAEV